MLAVSECLNAGKAAYLVCDYEGALRELQKGRTNQRKLENSDLCLQQGLV